MIQFDEHIFQVGWNHSLDKRPFDMEIWEEKATKMSHKWTVYKELTIPNNIPNIPSWNKPFSNLTYPKYIPSCLKSPPLLHLTKQLRSSLLQTTCIAHFSGVIRSGSGHQTGKRVMAATDGVGRKWKTKAVLKGCHENKKCKIYLKQLGWF